MAAASGMYVIGVATTIISLVGLELFGWIFRKQKAEIAAAQESEETK